MLLGESQALHQPLGSGVPAGTRSAAVLQGPAQDGSAVAPWDHSHLPQQAKLWGWGFHTDWGDRPWAKAVRSLLARAMGTQEQTAEP